MLHVEERRKIVLIARKRDGKRGNDASQRCVHAGFKDGDPHHNSYDDINVGAANSSEIEAHKSRGRERGDDQRREREIPTATLLKTRISHASMPRRFIRPSVS